MLIPADVHQSGVKRLGLSGYVDDIVAGVGHKAADVLRPQRRCRTRCIAGPVVAAQDRLFEPEPLRQLQDVEGASRLLAAAHGALVQKACWAKPADVRAE